MHCLTAWGQWDVELTASLLDGSEHCNSCNALPNCLGAVDSGTLQSHCLAALA